MGAGCRPLTTCLLLVSTLRAGSGGGWMSKDPQAARVPDSSGPLGRHFGKSRLLVISAPGPLDTSYRLMERQVDLGKGALRCHLALRDLLVMVLFQGSGGRPAQGKLLRVTKEGDRVVEEKLGPEEVGQVSLQLSLEATQFGMVLLRKSLHVYERFPYAVRVEAVMEAVDQMPLRKVERMTRRARRLKCEGSRAGRTSGQVHARRNLANRTTPNVGTMPNRSPVNRSRSIASMANRSLANRTMPIGATPNRSLANRTMSIGATPNRSLANRTMPIGATPNRSLANRTMSIGATPNRSLANRTMSIGATPNRSLANRTMSIGATPNRSLFNRSRSIASMANRYLANRTMPIGATPNRYLANRTMSIGATPNRSLANRTMPIGATPNRYLANRTMSIGATPNRSLANRTRSIGATPNRSLANRTVPKGSPAIPRFRPGSANSRKPFRSSGRRFPEKPGEAAPGKRKAWTSPRGSDGGRKAKTPRSPVNVTEREMVDQLMGQIKQKVWRMMAVNPRRPLQRRPDDGQVSQVGPHQNLSSAPPTVAPMGASIDLSGAGSQLPHTAAPSSSSGQTVNPEEVTTPDSSSGTARSQGGHDGRTTLPTVPLPNLGEEDSTGELQEVSPTLASGLDTPQTRKGQTHPPEPTTPHPTREKGDGGRRGSGGRAHGKDKKAERKDRENSGKGSRGKGRKNRRNRKNRNKNKKQGARGDKQSGSQQFLQHFLNKRRLLVITSPSKDSRLYVQQRDEYLEHVCQLAVRHMSVVNILGSPSNSSLTVEHYQSENEQALDIPVAEPVEPEVITELRNGFGMTFDEFFMVLVDYDMKVKQYFDVPIPIKALVDYMDTFPSRLHEIQDEKRRGVTCIKRESRLNINKFLARFQWKRRLLIISTPYEEDWAFQQQLTALTAQECNLGIRHFAVLKMMGSGEEASGSLELLPVNGRSQVETESLSWAAVSGLREHYQVGEDHFMMLLTGKDGAIRSWYLSPVWSLAAVYEQLDSTPERQEETRLQQRLGIGCDRDDGPPHYPGYHQRG